MQDMKHIDPYNTSFAQNAKTRNKKGKKRNTHIHIMEKSRLDVLMFSA
jgi:hypothetical protein